MSEDWYAESITNNWERIKKLEAKVATLEQQITSLNLAIEALAQSDEKLGYRLVFFEELGIEKHLADHNRELHERELNLDFKKDAGLSRAGIDY